MLLGLLGRDVYAIEGDQHVVELAPGDVSASIQQPILDAAYASLRASGQRAKLAIGLIGKAIALWFWRGRMARARS